MAFPRLDVSVRFVDGAFKTNYAFQGGVVAQVQYGDCPDRDIAINKWALTQDFAALHKAFANNYNQTAVSITKFKSSLAEIPSADELIGKIRQEVFIKSKVDQKDQKAKK